MADEAPVALLYQTEDLGRHLRTALAEVGIAVVYDAPTDAIDRAALEASGARVVVINLDPDLDTALDDAYALLDDDRYNVIFNEAQVSSRLAGWDHARWARHLLAKITGATSIDPPRPPGASAIPVPSPASVMDADPVDRSGPVEAGQAIEAHPAIDADPVVDVGGAVEAAPPVEAGIEPAPPAVSSEVAGPFAYDGIDVDALFADVAPPVVSADVFADDAASAAIPELADVPTLADIPTLPDIDFPSVAPPDAVSGADFGEEAFDGFVADLPVAPAIVLPDALPDVPPSSAFDMPDFPFDFDLATTDDATPTVDFEPAVPAVDLAPPPGKAVHEPVAAPPPSLAHADWSLEPIDFDAAAETPSPPTPEVRVEKISAAEFLAPQSESGLDVPVFDDTFSLELVPIEEAVAPGREERPPHENWLDPAKISASVAKVRKVWVLGASIGGPEAVREFIAQLPRDYPALFLLAQHMGAEFVDLMTQQLAKTTALTVRSPTHGERVGHGDLVIVPIAQRFTVDPDGVVVLSPLFDTPAYSPSIDQVLTDVADRFGANAGAIVFSGMVSDAAEGCRHLVDKGGTVYAQHPDSCVVSAMVDGVTETGAVSFFGTPRELAEKLLRERPDRTS